MAKTKFVVRSLSGRLEWQLLSAGLLRQIREAKKDLQAAASLDNFVSGSLWKMEGILAELLTICAEGNADKVRQAHEKTAGELSQLLQTLKTLRESS